MYKVILLYTNMLTQKQQTVFLEIQKYIKNNDQSPTLQELAALLGIKTKRGVVKHLDALEKKGILYRTSKPRGIVIPGLNQGSDTYDIPVLGYANAGYPLVYAQEDSIGTLKLDKQMVLDPKKTFALVVKGDSMNLKKINNVPIHEKNYIIVQKDASYLDGDVVLAIIDNAATVKTFKKGANSVILYPESNNPVHTPIYLREDSSNFINGRIIAVLENPIY
jgi:repressor LexA